jgi:hypothetical protein
MGGECCLFYLGDGLNPFPKPRNFLRKDDKNAYYLFSIGSTVSCPTILKLGWPHGNGFSIYSH